MPSLTSSVRRPALPLTSFHTDSCITEREAADADPDGIHLSYPPLHPPTQLTRRDRA